MSGAADPRAVVAVALSWLGTPYRHQASAKGVGCDCLGLARGIWREVVGPEPFPAPPYSPDVGDVERREVLAEAARRAGMIEIAAGDRRARADLPAGALVLFRMRRGHAAKHCGVLVGDGEMVHALSRHVVARARYDATWAARAAYAFLYPAGA